MSSKKEELFAHAWWKRLGVVFGTGVTEKGRTAEVLLLQYCYSKG